MPGVVERFSPEQARLRRLIRAGYFPQELPPPFTTHLFAKSAVQLAANWSQADVRKFWTLPEQYSVPRYGHVRRTLSIVNPINQLQVAYLISENWSEIRSRLKRSKMTEFHPEILMTNSTRAVSGVDFDAVSRRRSEILASHGRYIKTDITRFYPSVYTHSIAWALLGKEWVKKNLTKNIFKRSFANYLDKAVSAGQAGQTSGLPIGPDTSRILAELVMTELERFLKSKIPKLDERGVRYVDDMLVGFDEYEAPETILSKLSSGFHEYGLELNGSKTSMHGIGYPHPPEWVHFIRKFYVSQSVSKQRDDIDSFFEQALHLAERNARDNVLLFAVKRAGSFELHRENREHFINWLLYAARRSSDCLSFVVEHLLVEKTAGKQLPTKKIAEFINQQLLLRGEAAHTAEVSWLLFWARELRLKIASQTLKPVMRLRSGCCALLVMDLRNRKLIDGRINTSYWKSFATTVGLKSEMWLAAYEITKKGWWPGKVDSEFITEHPFFGDLWHREIEFYDPTQTARPAHSRPSLGKPISSTHTGFGRYLF